jgi:chromosome segregation protein
MDVRTQSEKEQDNLAAARVILQESIEKMEVDTQQREALMTRRDICRTESDQVRQTARHDRDRRQELAMRESALTTQLGSIREGIGRLEIQVERLQERRQQLRDAFNIKEDPTEDHKIELEIQLEARLLVESELGEARALVESVDHQMREQEKLRVEEQILEKQGDLEILLANLADDAVLVDWEEQLQLISNRIQRLGPINLAAIDEYKIDSERKDYLDEQNGELEEALLTLTNAIQKIDRETRSRFKETFELVNGHLQELFPKLFGGGHAYLEMTGNDLLDTGVTLMARPPGKKNASIHLLSGGEKAMTAIAMVFAIFKLNPAPFCMLDEVDAPLDDANVGRYAAMVKEMSSEVQFIFITHNKISMEAANQLIGVTMHEPGVSRLVTVDVNQAAELAEV